MHVSSLFFAQSGGPSQRVFDPRMWCGLSAAAGPSEPIFEARVALLTTTFVGDWWRAFPQREFPANQAVARPLLSNIFSQ